MSTFLTWIWNLCHASHQSSVFFTTLAAQLLLWHLWLKWRTDSSILCNAAHHRKCWRCEFMGAGLDVWKHSLHCISLWIASCSTTQSSPWRSSLHLQWTWAHTSLHAGADETFEARSSTKNQIPCEGIVVCAQNCLSYSYEDNESYQRPRLI